MEWSPSILQHNMSVSKFKTLLCGPPP